MIIYGKLTARIKKFTDHSHRCQNCGSYDLSVKVYRKFFHAFFIPIFAYGVKTAMIRCNICSQPYRSDSLQQHYEKMARSPFYLYSGPIIFCLLILGGITAHIITKKVEAGFIQHPSVGDIYLLKEDISSSYYFMKVVKVKNDSLVTYRNSTQYAFYVSEPKENDSFIPEELWISKKTLQEMFDKEIIESVDSSDKR